MAFTLKPLISNWKQHPHFRRFVDPRQRLRPVSIMSMSSSSLVSSAELLSSSKIIDSHLHIWASPKEAADEFPYSPGHQPTLQGDLDFLLECMEDADVDGALIVQPINHMFDHSLVTSALKKYPTKFAGCCLANPADDGSGVYQLEHLVVEMTNDVGKSLFHKAGELDVPVGIMCMKGLDLHLSEIEKLCCEFPSTTVILYHLAFCKPPTDDAERETFTSLLRLSQFPQIYLKFSALFRVSRKSFPYEDTSPLLSQVISSYGVNSIMWGTDFPYVIPECGYNGAKQSVLHISKLLFLTAADLEWIMGKTVKTLFQDAWQG